MGRIKYYWDGDRKGRAETAKKRTLDMTHKYKEEIAYARKNSHIYTGNTRVPHPLYRENMPVYLWNIGSVEAIFKARKTFGKGSICVLNFASYKNPGGGFLQGSRAQEECLCQSSYLYNVLREFPSYYEWNNKHLNKAMYENRAIFSPHIMFEQGEDQEFVNVITCAAPNLTPNKKYGYGITAEENSKILESRIKFVLDIAAREQVDTLILGAFGCGVFGQDATEVITLFNKYLASERKNFKQVIYAIPDSIHGDNYQKAIKVFKELEKKKEKAE